MAAKVEGPGHPVIEATDICRFHEPENVSRRILVTPYSKFVENMLPADQQVRSFTKRVLEFRREAMRSCRDC